MKIGWHHVVLAAVGGALLIIVFEQGAAGRLVVVMFGVMSLCFLVATSLTVVTREYGAIITINASPHAVFEFISGADAWPPEVVDVRSVPGRLEAGVGAAWHWFLVVRGRRYPGTTTVTTFDPPDKYGTRSRIGHLESETSYTISGDEGSSVLRLSVVSRLTPWAALNLRHSEEGLRTALERIRSGVESQQRSSKG